MANSTRSNTVKKSYCSNRSLIHQNKLDHPCSAVASRPLNDSRCNSSSTEAGVLIAYHQATARPLPKEVRTIASEGTQSPAITIPPGEASTRLLIRRPLIRVLVVSSPGGAEFDTLFLQMSP
ncbi:hypothetical protein AVEN_182386-1 [Araneus ventricosus]|uniref:Uncharacterized protein n=1 Tax=Araneus ventricosus TaxID=182803 RepID=A0A4Y2E6H7_ARAVE|nr:hypothetical protein AVEN_56586-1 [Araneus ventricosus]GBM24767.1 hypothetical protein AVEN_84850-1 [Araneus ventricosus]GBM24789.1 hypothetical protein AVEN_140857-1 [Araneus ventricosus]GBM24818.1 hypothetical protein AVEN_182386-1 [Araneus ventricosus]